MSINRVITADDPNVVGLVLARLTSGSRTSFAALTLSGATATTWAATLAGTADAQRANTLAQFASEVFDGLDASGKTAVAAILAGNGAADAVAANLDREICAWRARGGS